MTYQKPLLGADNNALVALIAINLVMYVLLGFLKVVYYLDSTPLAEFYQNIFHQFSLSPNNLIVQQKPWSLFTFNWLQDDFWSLLGNMIWLTAFGNILQNTGNNKHLFPIYLYSGLTGGIIFCIANTSTISSLPLLGAQSSVMAIVAASLLLVPNYRLLTNMGKGIPTWIVGVIYFALQIPVIIKSQSSSIIAIISATLLGIVYALLLKRKVDLGKWMHHLLIWINKSAAPKY